MRILVPALFCAAAAGAFAQGGGAIITLVMPPPAGDGYSALQSGGAVPAGAASVYYNPALLSGLQQATGSQIHFAHSEQALLPALDLPDDMRQDFTGVSFVIPGSRGFDFGVGLYRNRIDFGPNLAASGDSGAAPFGALETVHGLGFGLRLGLPVSVGGAVKYYDSDLGSFVDSSGGSRRADATGWAFDLGILALHRFEPLAFRNFRSLAVTPSAGLTWANLGADAWYVDPDESDPLPQTLRTSLGLRLELLDVLEFTAGADWEKETFSRTRFSDWGEEPTRTRGYSVSVLGFRYFEGTLRDRSGGRHETHQSIFAYEFNALQAYRVWNRARKGDVNGSSASMEEGYPFRQVRILGVSYRANPRFEIGRREIRSYDNGIRDGQEAWYFSLSI